VAGFLFAWRWLARLAKIENHWYSEELTLKPLSPEPHPNLNAGAPER